MSRKADILQALIARLEELVTSKDVGIVNFEVIKLAMSDFEDWELPAIQVIDQGELVTHEMGRARKEWDVAVELVMKSSETGEVFQKDLFDLQYKVERNIWQDPNLGGTTGVIDCKYLGSQTDLHMVKPMFYCRIDIQIRYYDPLVSDC